VVSGHRPDCAAMLTHDIGGLKVWADPANGAIMLGNKAASQSALSLSRPHDNIEIATVAVPNGAPDFEGVFAPLGTNGRVVRLRFWGTQATPGFASLLADATDPGPPETTLDIAHDPDGRRTLWRDGSPVFSDQPKKGTERTFDPLAELLIAACGPGRTAALVHGSAVSWRGATILLAGRSGAGKSTLAAALCADGGAYVCDDTLVLRADDGAALPVRCRPSFKAGTWSLLEPLFPALTQQPEFFKKGEPYRHLPAAPWARHPVPLDAVIFPLYAPQATPELISLAPEEVVLMLAKGGFWTSGEMLGPALDALPVHRAFALRHDGIDSAMIRLREIVETVRMPI